MIDEHTMSDIGNVLQSCIPEICVALLMVVVPINLKKKKKALSPICKNVTPSLSSCLRLMSPCQKGVP